MDENGNKELQELEVGIGKYVSLGLGVFLLLGAGFLFIKSGFLTIKSLILIGGIIGTAFVISGLLERKYYPLLSQGLFSIGIGLQFFSIYAANRYFLLSTYNSLIFGLLISIFALIISNLFSSQLIAIVSLFALHISLFEWSSRIFPYSIIYLTLITPFGITALYKDWNFLFFCLISVFGLYSIFSCCFFSVEFFYFFVLFPLGLFAKILLSKKIVSFGMLISIVFAALALPFIFHFPAGTYNSVIIMTNVFLGIIYLLQGFAVLFIKKIKDQRLFNVFFIISLVYFVAPIFDNFKYNMLILALVSFAALIFVLGCFVKNLLIRVIAYLIWYLCTVFYLGFVIGVLADNIPFLLSHKILKWQNIAGVALFKVFVLLAYLFKRYRSYFNELIYFSYHQEILICSAFLVFISLLKINLSYQPLWLLSAAIIVILISILSYIKDFKFGIYSSFILTFLLTLNFIYLAFNYKNIGSFFIALSTLLAVLVTQFAVFEIGRRSEFKLLDSKYLWIPEIVFQNVYTLTILIGGNFLINKFFTEQDFFYGLIPVSSIDSMLSISLTFSIFCLVCGIVKTLCKFDITSFYSFVAAGHYAILFMYNAFVSQLLRSSDALMTMQAIFYGLSAAVSILIGFKKNILVFRLFGFVLVAVSLWFIGQLVMQIADKEYRLVVQVLIGVILLLISFMYQRLACKDLITNK